MTRTLSLSPQPVAPRAINRAAARLHLEGFRRNRVDLQTDSHEGGRELERLFMAETIKIREIITPNTLSGSKFAGQKPVPTFHPHNPVLRVVVTWRRSAAQLDLGPH